MSLMPDRGFRRAAAVFAAALSLTVAGLATPASAADPGTACTRPEVSGDTTIQVRFQGQSYPVLLHIPAALPAGRVPLVLNLHGSSGNGPGQMDYSGLR